MQIFGFENVFTEIGARNHKWCGLICDYVTLPFEIFQIISAAIVLRRKRIGILGAATLFLLLLWPLMWLSP